MLKRTMGWASIHLNSAGLSEFGWAKPLAPPANRQTKRAERMVNRCILALTLDNIVHAAEQNQVSNIINTKLVKDSGLIGSYGLITDVQHV